MKHKLSKRQWRIQMTRLIKKYPKICSYMEAVTYARALLETFYEDEDGYTPEEALAEEMSYAN